MSAPLYRYRTSHSSVPSLSVAEINNPAPEAKAFVWMVDGAGVMVGRASDCSLEQQPPPCLAFSSFSSLPLLLTDTLSPLSVLLMSGGGREWPMACDASESCLGCVLGYS